jgi:hypothetical protein
VAHVDELRLEPLQRPVDDRTADQNHLLRTSSTVRSIEYGSDSIVYEKWDAASRERLKLGAWEPGSIEGGTMTRVLEVASTAKRVVVRRKPEPVLRLPVTVDGATRFQEMDGFGVNVTPAQWRDGALRPTLDLLVDDLGTSIVRLDCYGKADWLDPAKRGEDGRWPEAYLAEVYRFRVFTECWDTCRHLGAKGVDVHLNVSGRIPAAWAGPDGQTLVDFDAYAEAACRRRAGPARRRAWPSGSSRRSTRRTSAFRRGRGSATPTSWRRCGPSRSGWTRPASAT